jgi:hypothetical protein
MKWLAIISLALTTLSCQASAAPTAVVVAEIPTRAPSSTPVGAAEKAYMARIQPILNRQADTMEALGPLLANPQFDNPVWRVDIGSRLFTLRQNYREIKDIEAPRSMEAARAKIVETFDRYDNGANLIQQGIELRSIPHVEQGRLEWAAGRQSLAEANNLIARMTPSPR